MILLVKKTGLVLLFLMAAFSIPRITAYADEGTPLLPFQERITILNTLEINLPTIRILPDSPFYQVKTTIEELRLVFARTPLQKAAVLIDISETRLAEYFELYQSGRFDLANTVLTNYETIEKYLNRILEQNSLDTITSPSITNKASANHEKYSLIKHLSGRYNIHWEK